MAEFTRRSDGKNIFEGTSDEAVEIILRIKDDFESRFNNNPENKMQADVVMKLLSSEYRVCFFQKQTPDSKDNRPRHKIIIPLGDENAIETIVGLKVDKLDTFTEVYSYRVLKFKVVSFFNEPVKDTTRRKCKFRFVDIERKAGTNEDNFKELFKAVEACQIPVVDINKERDKQIWHKYVIALKKLVKQKEQVWKIHKVSQPYSEKKDEESERANYIDIYINEKELIDKLLSDIESLFNDAELEDYGVSEEKVFVEFKNYRELSEEELNQLKELGEELFYELSNSSPIHYFSGELQFKFIDAASKDEVYDQIKEKLSLDYQLDVEIEKNGLIELNDNDIPHLQKILDDHFRNLIDLHKNNLVQLKVNFNTAKDLLELKDKVKAVLNSEGLSRSKVFLSQDQSSIVIEDEVFIHPKKFIANNLEFVCSISRFSPGRQIRFKPIDGLEVINNAYQITSKSREEYDLAFNKLKQNFPGVYFHKKPTQYVFKPTNRVNLERLRNFKTATDLQGKSQFFFTNSTLNITAENLDDFNRQIRRIKEAFPEAVLEEKPYKPTYEIQFKTGLESKRQAIINKIQNEIRNAVAGRAEFDAIKNHTRMLFSYRFSSDEERDKFKEIISNACNSYVDIATLSFDSNLGRTIYELNKNETLEEADERETMRNIFNASFVYLTPEQNIALNKVLSEQGELASFKSGVQFGKLVKKDGNKLKFRITEDFDTLINAPLDRRLEISDITKGYIKPIFPGDLTNIDRMIRAMEKVVNPGGKSQYFFNKAGFAYKIGFPINKNLPNFLFDPNYARQSSSDIEEEKRKVLADLNEPLLKEQQKQLEAVAKTLSAKDLALIQGPPGTGKTTVIAEIIWQSLLRDPQSKILITSQTNLAVDNALERIKGKKLVRPIRIGTIDKFEDEGKVYSNDRINKWLQAKTNSNDEKLYSENAVCEWIENVQLKCSDDEKLRGPIKLTISGRSKLTT